MLLLLAILFGALVSSSRQTDWADLVHLSEQEATATIHSSFFGTTDGATEAGLRSQHAVPGDAWDTAWQHTSDQLPSHHLDSALKFIPGPSELHAPFKGQHTGIDAYPVFDSGTSQPDFHLPSVAQHADIEDYPILESGALPPAAIGLPAVNRLWASMHTTAPRALEKEPRKLAVSSSSQPTKGTAFNDLPALTYTDAQDPPAALTLEQRERILLDAEKTLASVAGRLKGEIAPFKGAQVAPRLLQEFGVSTAYLREYRPGFLLQSRSGHPQFRRGGDGKELHKAAAHQVLVYRYASHPATPRSRTLFQLVGLLDLNQNSYNSLKYFPGRKTARVHVTTVGEDSFIDHSSISSG